jgi:acyl-coenzyme A thioesterase PaaI-like protein
MDMEAIIRDFFHKAIPKKYQDNALLKMFGIGKIPMLFFLGPKVVCAEDEKVEIQIPLSWRSKNHLNSMYFGALAAGADLAGGFAAMKKIFAIGKEFSLVFKDFEAQFLKRAHGDVHFTCIQGREIEALLEKALETKERENLGLDIVATVPSESEVEPVATFKLTLSVKLKE